jgi:hypothetical protein
MVICHSTTNFAWGLTLVLEFFDVRGIRVRRVSSPKSVRREDSVRAPGCVIKSSTAPQTIRGHDSRNLTMLMQAAKTVPRPVRSLHAPLFMLIHIYHTINDDYVKRSHDHEFLEI